MDIKEALDYNSNTGEFIWKISPNNRVPVGRIAGSLQSEGYLQLRYKGKIYLLHRLAFWWVNGYWPKEVDHKNRDKMDNRIKNLKDTTRSENNLNKDSKRISKHVNGLWRFRIQISGKEYAKYFKTEKEAEEYKWQYA